MEKSYKELLNTINTFIFDVDGVLTENSIAITAQGELLRSLNTKDSFAIQKAISEDYTICFISSGSLKGLDVQLKAIGVTNIYSKTPNKAEALDEFLDIYDLNPEHTLYMGDDVPDKYPMQMVALPCCPQDAVPEIKETSKYVSHQYGGKGCVRDVIEQVLKVQGCWS